MRLLLSVKLCYITAKTKSNENQIQRETIVVKLVGKVGNKNLTIMELQE